MYLLFYSNHCNHCKKFKRILDKINYTSYFEIIVVDKKGGQRHPFVAKYNIKEVPSIIVNQRIYAGKKAFAWLESKVKGINTSIETHNTRLNKIPTVSGNMAFKFSHEGSFAEFGSPQVIITPPESDNVERPQFILKPDNITGTITSKDEKQQFQSERVLSDYERLNEERKRQDEIFKKQLPML